MAWQPLTSLLDQLELMGAQHARAPLWLLVVASLLLSACGKEPVGATCLASSECSAGLCYVNVCLDPDADDDNDGLSNAREHALGTHPQKADSDEDGKSDAVEIGAGIPLDRDGDGTLDALESQTHDTDLDCLPDEQDADNLVANTDPAVLARDVCSDEGVCAGQAVHISATCQIGLGTLTCLYTQVPGWSAVESCDGIDNDCDGATDEGHSYQGTAVGKTCQGEGACGEGIVQCKQGRAACSSNPGGTSAQASEELCNNLDDDCDGETDEGFGLPDAPVGVPCLGTGECGVGMVICGADGVPLCSTDPGGPQSQAVPETCNTLDDDCDGKTDEQIALAGTPLGGACVGRGACGPGTIVCDAKGQPVCSSNPEGPASKAKPESCNQLDDNCNGQTDEGFTWQGAALGAVCDGVGACEKGVVVCGKGGKATCSTQPDAPGVAAKLELCDGTDDDCDGATDEGFVWQGQTLGKACEGSGICGKGVVECAASGAVTCSTNADGSKAESTVESCNGLDDDCDGVTDEDVPAAVGPKCAAVGICADAVGKPGCVSGAWSCTFDAVSGYQGPNETSCDQLDNDCDGLTDEGLPHTWGPTAKQWLAGAPSPRLDASAATAASSKEFCIAGGLAARITSEQPATSGEFWCLDPLKGSWRLHAMAQTIARQGATLVSVPAGWSGTKSGPAWWLLGGITVTGGQGSPIAIDAATGAITPVTLPSVLPSSAAYVVGPIGNRGLLQVPTGAIGNAKVTRLTRSQGAWVEAPGTPQLAIAHVSSSCQDVAGGVWLYGLSSSPSGAVTDKTIVGSLWHLPQGATKWQSRPAPTPPAGWSAVHGGRLLCEPAPGEIWFHGARTTSAADAALLGLRRFSIQTSVWSKPSVDVTPKTTGGYGGRVGSSVVMAWGRTDKSSSGAVWAVQQGKWVTIDAAPLVAVGAKFVQTSSGLLRVGGVGVLHQLEASPTRPTWRYNAKGWSQLVAPPSVASQSRRVWPIVVPAGSDDVLIWGGVQKLPAPVTASVLAAGLIPSPGAVRLTPSTGKWTPLSPVDAGKLPAVRTGATYCHGTISGAPVAWLLGVPAAGGSPRLWRVDTKLGVSKLLWKDATSGPASVVGAHLLWDANADRLVYIGASSGLEVWAWPLSGTGKSGTTKWSKLTADVGTASGTVVVIGDLTIDDLLIAILPTDSAAQPAFRQLQLGPKPALLTVALTPPNWRAPTQSVWTPSGAVIAPGPAPGGLPVPGFLVWPRSCAP